MTEEERAQRKANSDAFQDSIGEPRKPDQHYANASGFYNPDGVDWWLEADIRPQATWLKVNTLNAKQLRCLILWMRASLEGQTPHTVEAMMALPNTRYQLTMNIEIYNTDEDYYSEHPNWSASIGPVYDNLEAAAALTKAASDFTDPASASASSG